jgi:alanyl-tRNA synthetase
VVAFAGVPDELVSKLPAGDWVGEVLKVLGGKGGGRPNSAQGQGTELGKVDEALALAADMAKLKL